MGLDLYAGTMTRYYSGNWKSVVQQMAEANGYSFSRIRPDGSAIEQDDECSSEETQAAVEVWRDDIISQLRANGLERLSAWPEDDVSPYYTDKPDWDAFGAMLLVAACRCYDLEVPPTVNKDWDFYEHEAIVRLRNDKEKYWSLFKGATVWLPLDFAICFKTILPNDNACTIATLRGLEQELNKLNELAWRADKETILSWSQSEGYPVDAAMGEDGTVSKQNISEHTEYDTESLAKFAFSIFYQALLFAKEHQSVIIMDY